MKKKYFRYFFLALFLILNFRIFQYYPGMSFIKDLWIFATILFLLGPYLYWKVNTGFRFLQFEVYILLLVTGIPILSGYAAFHEFGQPVAYGVLAQRNMVLGVGALALIYAIRRHIISIRDVEKTMLFLAWGTLAFYLTFDLFFDPSQFMEYREGFIGGVDEKASFKHNTIFIIFGFIYYAFKAYRNKSVIQCGYPAIFLTYLILINGGRMLILSVLATLVFYMIRRGSLERKILFVPTVTIAIMIFISTLSIINEDYMTSLGNKMSDAFTVVLTGDETSDVSANARIIETAIALPYIERNIAIGNGDISNRWGGGYEEVLGGYFYPSDIGIIGVLYMYGIVGLILFLLQFIFAIQFSNRIKNRENYSSFLDATQGFLFFYFVNSLTTGNFANSSEIGFIFIAMLWCIAAVSKELALSRGQSMNYSIRK